MTSKMVSTLCISVFLFTVSANSSELPRIIQNYFPGEKCIDTSRLGYVIVKKIDDHHYEMKGDQVMLPAHALLETKNAIFESTGHPLGISIEPVGSKQMKLENGFLSEYDLWRECGEQKEPSGSSKDNSKAKKKGINCQDSCFKKEEKHLFKKGETLEKCLLKSCE
jgi:hypothetical protein